MSGSGRPSLSGGGRSRRLAVSIAPELQRKAEERAAALGITLSELVRRAVEREVARPLPRRRGARA